MGAFRYFILGICCALSACGKDVQIATKVKFHVLFSQKLIEVSFVTNPLYQFPIGQRQSFDRLGSVFLKWNPIQLSNEVGVDLSGDAAILNQEWPTETIQALPNGSQLPSSVTSDTLELWKHDPQNGIELSLYFNRTPDLILGGRLLSPRFSLLKKNSIGTQKFKTANGDVNATISLLGRTDELDGGIYFFGNFGANPFVKSNGRELPADDLEFEIEASEPAEFFSARQIPNLKQALSMKSLSEFIQEMNR